jgi:protease I
MDLKQCKIAVLIEKYFDEREFLYPLIRLGEEGVKVVIAGGVAGAEYTGKSGYTARADAAFGDLKTEDFNGVIVPGGYAPDHFRRSRELLDFIKKMDCEGKLIAYICHAGWLLISAGILKGRRATAVGAIKDDMINAGVIWSDERVTTDGNHISACHADDVGAFMKSVVSYLKKM